MEIVKINIDGKEYRIFDNIPVFGRKSGRKGFTVAAEEALESVIQKKISAGLYDEVRLIDERYAYVIPQVIADAEDEALIAMTIEDMDEDFE
jgi:hypothetical protein